MSESPWAPYEKAIKICTFLVQRGFLVDFLPGPKDIVIDPKPPAAIVERIVANEAILMEYLVALDGRPATNHRFAPLFNLKADAAKYLGICLTCGVPWPLHGEPPEKFWEPVEDLLTVETRKCVPLAGATDGREGELSARAEAEFDRLRALNESARLAESAAS